MEEWLVQTTEFITLAITAMALLIIVYGTVEAFVGALRTIFFKADNRLVWLKFGRWLIAALTFLLAADILESSIKTDWEGIARLAAIAAIRTFLNYFLERDILEFSKLEAKHETASPE